MRPSPGPRTRRATSISPATVHPVRHPGWPRLAGALSPADRWRLACVPALTAAIVYFLCILPARRPASGAESATGYVALIEKDASWHPVPPHVGGPAGGVWYAARGRPLRLGLRATGLGPGTRYLVELNVDGTTYEVASRAATPAGELAIDTTLAAFVDGPCAGPHPHAPGSLAGTHRIKFLLKRNGAPGPATPSGAACAGNGDHDYAYVLFEEKVAVYDGGR